MDRFPEELKLLNQWVGTLLRGKKNKRYIDKIPINPSTGRYASVTDPMTWGTFDKALSCGYKPVGLILTKNDPYTIIDLDNPINKQQEDRHRYIITKLNSYTEVSVSGTGVHIIVRGSIPASIKIDNVEIYSKNKAIVCTGRSIGDKPIVDCQDILNILSNEMSSEQTTNIIDSDIVLSDEDIISIGMSAKNSKKFLQLCNGDWPGIYPSQSEADFALLSILAFYSKNNDQVRRLFRYSSLGKREKSTKNNRYLDLSLKKIRSNNDSIIPVDYKKKTVDVIYNDCKNTIPQGLVGDIAQYIYSSAIRPVKDVGIIAAIGLMAGICGRSYNISGTGLNQYLILLAGTGTGKEGISSGIDNLIKSVRKKIPNVDRFVGPSGFASGQALYRVLDEKPCFLSVIGEFGLMLQQMLDPKSFGPNVMLRRTLLDIYNKSGSNKILRPNVYSDTKKNTSLVQSPSVTLIGETTPSTFYDYINNDHISDGLLPRFSILEYSGKRPKSNINAFHDPSQKLVQKLTDLLSIVLRLDDNNDCMNVKMDGEATRIMLDFDIKADKIINESNNDETSQLWNRAHLKALKISALISVGVNHNNPIVDKDSAIWAINFVELDINTILDRFHNGDIGRGDQKQEADTRRSIQLYLSMTITKRSKYRIPKNIVVDDIIPYAYLRRRLKALSSFKNDRRGATIAITSILSDMVKGDVLRELDKKHVLEKYKSKSPIYTIGPSW